MNSGLLAAVAACVVSAVIVVATPGHAESLEGTLKKVKHSRALVVGYRADAWPFSFAPEPGKPDGYSIDLCQRIAAGVQQQLGLDKLDVKYVEVTTQNRIQAVADGKVDRIGKDQAYTPACDLVCPVQARVFGDIDDPNSEVSKRIKATGAVQLKKQFGTGPQVYYALAEGAKS